MSRNNNEKNGGRPTMFQILINYLTTTSPVLLVVHLLYIMLVSATLSASYVVAFHWSTIVQIYKQAHDIKGFSTNLKSSVETDNKLNVILSEIMGSTGGKRAYIYRYHNGLAAVSSVPFFFQSNTHEVIAPGANRLMAHEQRIPASFNIAINNQYVRNQCSFIRDTTVDRNSQNYYYFQSRGAKSFVRCPIYMRNGDLFGFVGIDFADTTTTPSMDKIQRTIASAAQTIGNIFETSKK
jgi:hypothetical protein